MIRAPAGKNNPRDEFADYVVDLLAPLGRISARRMFSGHGIFCGGRMFALIASQTLYFKTDEASRHHFELAGSQPFVYTSRSRQVTLSYWSAPGEAMESPPQALHWARLALDAALHQPGCASARTASPSTRRTTSGRVTRKK